MMRSKSKREVYFWAVLPAVITIFLSLVMLAPKHISGLSSVMPLLPLIPIFFWGLHQAGEMPYWFVFLLGIVMDVATGLPMGFSSLLNILFLAFVHAQHKYIHKEGFIIQWGYFTLLLAAMQLLGWLLLSVYYGAMPGIRPALIQWVLTICCYPVFHQGFAVLYAHGMDRRWR